METVSRRAGLWIAFALVHLAVAVSGFVWPTQPMGDLALAYVPWVAQALAGEIPGIASSWVYPQLALVPMVVVGAFAQLLGGYEIAWAVFVTACDAVAFALLVGRGRSRGRLLAASFWLAFALLLGPVGMYRIDAFTVPLAIAGLLWLAGRPAVASVLLTVGAWIKVWPAALVVAAVIAVRRRLVVLAAALATTAVVSGGVVLLGGAGNLLGFVSGQTGRGLQLEAPVSGFFLWRVVAGAPGAAVVYDAPLNTLQVTGDGVDVVSALMTPLLFVVVAGIAALGVVKVVRGAAFVRVVPPLAAAMVLAFIVVNKVGSPQFQVWLIAPIAFALAVDRRRWTGLALAALGSALLTHLVYPLAYIGVMNAEPVPVAILTARNILLVVMLVVSIVGLARVPARATHPASVL